MPLASSCCEFGASEARVSQEERAAPRTLPNSVIRRRSGWRAAFFIYNSVMEPDIIGLFKANSNSQPGIDSRSAKQVRLGIGDDGAILAASDRDTVWVTDTITEGVHFDLSRCSLEQVGRKAMAVNLSDIAAMAADPTAALVTLVLPRTMTLAEVEALASGICGIADQYDVAIVGGDTNRHAGPLIVGIALSGSVDFADAWKINGSLAGDLIVVTGTLGGSIAGKHLDFVPRVKLAQHVADNYSVNAATDISDSLAVDLGHVIEFSGVSAELSTDNIPVSDDATKLSATSNRTALDHALHDGEDFELLLSMPSDAARKLVADEKAREIAGGEMYVIGRVFAGQPGSIVDEKGTEISRDGYQH